MNNQPINAAWKGGMASFWKGMDNGYALCRVCRIKAVPFTGKGGKGSEVHRRIGRICRLFVE